VRREEELEILGEILGKYSNGKNERFREGEDEEEETGRWRNGFML
jgi:hypothetical protein